MKKRNLKTATVAALAVILVVAVGPAVAMAGGGDLDTLADRIGESGNKWAPALLVLGGLVVGGAIMLGSHQSGEKVRNFILGALFLIIAAMGMGGLRHVQNIIGW